MLPQDDGFGPLLGVWAHPDDEAYLSAGLMAAAAEAGHRVVCVTATKGEAGSTDEERWPSARLGEVRAEELMRSLGILGVQEHHWLDYPDGACADVSLDEGTTRVQAFVDEVQPRTVLTFGPEGMTGHPDHKAVCAWTTAAFHRSAPPGGSLYYATYTPEWAAEFAPRMDRFNVFMEPGTPPTTPHAVLAIDYELPADVLELKVKALSAHVSQLEAMLDAFGHDFFRTATRGEYFRLAGRR